MIKLVLFDLGLTLIKNNAPQIYKTCFSNLGKNFSTEEIEIAYHMTNKFFMRERKGLLGKGIDFYLQEYVNIICNELHCNQLSNDIYNEISKSYKIKWELFDFTINTINIINNIGIKTGLITNWDFSCREILHKTTLEKYLNPIIISSEECVEKPSATLFEKALSYYNFSPDECIYIGDNYYDDFIGSNSVGMNCFIINPENKLGINEISNIKTITSIKELPQIIEKINLKEVKK